MKVTCKNCGRTSQVGGPHTKDPTPWVCSKCNTLHGKSGKVHSLARKRPNWDEYFMTMAVVASMRGTCDRRYVGCVIVSTDNQVVCTGYNGSAPGAPHCCDEGVGHLMHDGHCVRTIHAERNAIAQAAKHGKSTDGCKIYVTTHPCPGCLVLLAAAGIHHIVVLEAYHEEEDEVSAILARDARIHIEEYEGEPLWERPIER